VTTEETTELVGGIGTEVLVEMITAELVDAIGEELLAEAIADELEAVYQSSVSNQRLSPPPLRMRPK
jgi:hypothetical protein